jgi:hypothetical protein
MVVRVQVLAARMLQLVGWAGVAGLMLMLAASTIVALAWVQRSAQVLPVIATDSKLAPAPRDQPVEPTRLELSDKGEVPLLVTQITQAAKANGLTWPAAEYRIVAATQEKPASLEVRCVLRGSYPKLRSMLAQLINGVPGFSLRELSMSRASSEVADVDAKVVMAVFLRDEAPARARRQLEAQR